MILKPSLFIKAPQSDVKLLISDSVFDEHAACHFVFPFLPLPDVCACLEQSDSLKVALRLVHVPYCSSL